MAEIVLIHGIGAPGDGNAAAMKDLWLDALAAGSPPSVCDSLKDRAEMVFYRDWTWAQRHGAQGPDEAATAGIDPEVVLSMDELALAWLSAAQHSPDSSIAQSATIAVDSLLQRETDGAQGPMRAVRSAVAALAGIPLFGSGAYSAVQNLNRTNLWQVTAYVNDIDGTKHAVWGRFARVVGPETRIVIAHSLGTVVAYEAIRHLGTELDLLLTTGSPLGLARVIYPKLVPDAAYPDTVGRWVNVADPDDFVAAEPRLARLFTDANGAERIEDVEVHNRGRFAWHRISAYLSHDDVRRVVWGALDA